MSARIGIVDYGCGNIRSLFNAFLATGAKADLVSSPDALNDYDKLVLPGVGAFERAFCLLKDGFFIEALEHKKKQGMPILGICLGMQLLCSDSDEVHNVEKQPYAKGLGWIDASVRHFSKLTTSDQKVPHMGWNEIYFREDEALFDGIETGSDVYFVHSHAVTCDQPEHVLATCSYGLEFAAAVKKDNVLGCQFHPEKSHKLGLKIIQNFVGM